jgi:hypothetical protein
MTTSPGAAGEPLPSNTRPLVKMVRSTVAPQQGSSAEVPGSCFHQSRTTFQLSDSASLA